MLRDPAERAFLDPVSEVLERGTSPGGAWIAECQGQPRELAELLEHFETK